MRQKEKNTAKMGFMDIPHKTDQRGKDIPDNIWDKWGEAAYRGYQAVPHDLFRFQARLGLSHGELVTLLNILDFWWEADRRPFPGAVALANRMGATTRSVQRHLKVLQEKKYAVRERNDQRRFDLDGLVRRLGELVRDEVESEGEESST